MTVRRYSRWWPMWNGRFVMWTTCCGRHLVEILLAGLPVSLALFCIAGIGGCGSSHGASVATEKMRNATNVQLLPDFHLFWSLTRGTVAIDRDQWESMGFPASATITDANTIGQFAQLIEDIGYKRTLSRYLRTPDSMTVIAWRGNEELGSFAINGDMLCIPGFGSFRSKQSEEYIFRELRRVLPYGRRMENVIQRSGDIESVARTLYVNVLSRDHSFSSVKDRWCDAILEAASTYVEDTKAYLREHTYPFGLKVDVEGTIRQAREYAAGMEQDLAPDADGVRRVPFALNSQYGENPEDDTILLFESEPGWNKVGGPELLSSRFADPNGCFIYQHGWGLKFLTNEQVERIKAAAHKAAQENRPLEFRLSTLLKAIDDDADNAGKSPSLPLR